MIAARVTLTDVARAASVDVSLVSRVLRGQPVKVREETRSRILAQARELGYRPNAIARTLKTSRAGAYGLVIPTFTNPVYAQIIAGAEAAAARLGCAMMTTSGQGWEAGDWLEVLDGGRVDGLLVAGGPALDLASLRVPSLLVNRAADGARSIVLDDERASRLAVEHLAGLGHCEIAFLGGPEGTETARRRSSGFVTAMESLGALAREPLVGDYTAAGGRAAMHAAITSGRRFTALVAANLPSGVGALQALREAGIGVPTEMSVVAIHDAEIAQLVSPTLTSIRMPLEELGARGIELLASGDPAEPIREVVGEPMELKIRESTGPAPAA